MRRGFMRGARQTAGPGRVSISAALRAGMPHAVAVAVAAAQEQIQRAAQVAFALVVGQAFSAEQAVQRQQVNRRLQLVAARRGRRGQRGGA